VQTRPAGQLPRHTGNNPLHGNGSNVVYVQGGGNISVVGATFAPEDNLFLGGATGGKGYGQLLAFYIHYQGNAAIVESYNPLALVYAPVLVR